MAVEAISVNNFILCKQFLIAFSSFFFALVAATPHGAFKNNNNHLNYNYNYNNNYNNNNNINNNNIYNTLITLFNISTKNLNTLLITTIKLLPPQTPRPWGANLTPLRL